MISHANMSSLFFSLRLCVSACVSVCLPSRPRIGMSGKGQKIRDKRSKSQRKPSTLCICAKKAILFLLLFQIHILTHTLTHTRSLSPNLNCFVAIHLSHSHTGRRSHSFLVSYFLSFFCALSTPYCENAREMAKGDFPPLHRATLSLRFTRFAVVSPVRESLSCECISETIDTGAFFGSST